MELRAAFDAFDSGKDGTISYAEFKQALENVNYSEETLQEIFASVVSSIAVSFLCGVDL
jgi:Ca2+-binding EF-hand superfamily protein